MLRTRVRVGRVGGLVLGVVFAALLTFVGTLELFLGATTPHFGLPAPLTLRVPSHSRVVRQGPKSAWSVQLERTHIVVPRGTTLEPDNEEHRAAVLQDAAARAPSLPRLGSQFFIYLLICLLPIFYFRNFGHHRLRLLRSQLGILGLMLALVVGAKALLLFTALPDLWVPAGAVALWVAVSFDRRTAIVVDVMVALLVASFLRFDLVLLAVLFARGTAASMLVLDRKRPRQMVLAATFAGFVAALVWAALQIVLDGHVGILADISRGLGSSLVACVGGSIVSGAVALVLRDLANLALGQVSRDKLLDLTDIESPLLQKMASDAAGSWEHSRAMANLAEAAAASVGADSLLTRVGAYYHDVGKTVQPKYFIENLGPGESSPHDELEPAVSADAIMAHVVLGTAVLREAGVPEPVVEFVYTHHGTQRVEYFWRKYEKQAAGSDEELDDSGFRYPGTEPLTKETAILMLVDAIEAASRTVAPPDREHFRNMIRQVVFDKMADGQLDDCGLAIRDLRLMTERLTSTLVNMYHGRIKYPWQAPTERPQAAPGSPAPPTAQTVPPSPRPPADLGAPAPAADGEPELGEESPPRSDERPAVGDDPDEPPARQSAH